MKSYRACRVGGAPSAVCNVKLVNYTRQEYTIHNPEDHPFFLLLLVLLLSQVQFDF
jgi:hypothetical protein